MAKTILVIDDNNNLRENTAEILDLAGYKTLTAENGKQGVDIAVREKPSLIVCDIMMPELYGYGVLHLLRKNAETQNIPFIFLTAKTERSDFRKGMEMGADDYITKPFHLDELKLRVSNLLQLQQRQRTFLQSQVLPPKPVEALPAVNDVFVEQLYKLLDENLNELQLNVDFLASNMAMSRSSLNRKLKSVLDISANDLIRRYRLQKATSMLAQGYDIAATSYKVGFNTPSYFTQCFREQYGITPSAYIDSVRAVN